MKKKTFETFDNISFPFLKTYFCYAVPSLIILPICWINSECWNVCRHPEHYRGCFYLSNVGISIKHRNDRRDLASPLEQWHCYRVNSWFMSCDTCRHIFRYLFFKVSRFHVHLTSSQRSKSLVPINPVKWWSHHKKRIH